MAKIKAGIKRAIKYKINYKAFFTYKRQQIYNKTN